MVTFDLTSVHVVVDPMEDPRYVFSPNLILVSWKCAER